jgi:DNA-directed RNA polymerase subunit RPC12/RpoP
MLKCKICGCEFNAVKERHYISRDNGKTGLTAAFGSNPEDKLYDTFDCTACGCQIVAQERKRKYDLRKDKDIVIIK